MRRSKNLRLYLPEEEDAFDVEDINHNFDVLDDLKPPVEFKSTRGWNVPVRPEHDGELVVTPTGELVFSVKDPNSFPDPPTTPDAGYGRFENTYYIPIGEMYIPRTPLDDSILEFEDGWEMHTNASWNFIARFGNFKYITFAARRTGATINVPASHGDIGNQLLGTIVDSRFASMNTSTKNAMLSGFTRWASGSITSSTRVELTAVNGPMANSSGPYGTSPNQISTGNVFYLGGMYV